MIFIPLALCVFVLLKTIILKLVYRNPDVGSHLGSMFIVEAAIIVSCFYFQFINIRATTSKLGCNETKENSFAIVLIQTESKSVE